MFSGLSENTPKILETQSQHCGRKHASLLHVAFLGEWRLPDKCGNVSDPDNGCGTGRVGANTV
jgi:hypothetical protein